MVVFANVNLSLLRGVCQDDYHRMAKAGILSEDDRVELVEGEIMAMAPIGRRQPVS
ncbi:MAG: Uncharacterized protein XD60_1437 [Acetothermia bacterium 64_32]|nr:MAG: Uncharacterized protein XD60_1437 [Acetothermia bacterium 64_32]